jgi:hypothetical protein
MSKSHYDVFICYGEPAGAALAARIASGLRRRGFRVFAEGRGAAAAGEPTRLALIVQTADFVAVLPPETLESLPLEEDPVRREMAHAAAHRRNVVQVRLLGDASGPAEAALADLFALRRSQMVTYDESRGTESIALVAHRLSSDGTVDERRIMRRSTRLFWVAGIILLAGVALQEVPRLIEEWSRPRLLAPIPPFALYWAGVGQRLESGRLVDFPIGSETAVSAGDRLRLAFAPSADGYAYVVSRNARGETDVLFPTDVARGASRVQAGTVYFAPVETGWLPVEDESAEGSIYLIAGYDPLHNLEELIEQPDGTGSPAGRRQLLDATVGGLLDGRHGATERRVWTGKLHPIDPGLKWASGPGQATVTLADGRAVTTPLAVQPGLISTSVEIRLTYAR